MESYILEPHHDAEGDHTQKVQSTHCQEVKNAVFDENLCDSRLLYEPPLFFVDFHALKDK